MTSGLPYPGPLTIHTANPPSISQAGTGAAIPPPSTLVHDRTSDPRTARTAMKLHGDPRRPSRCPSRNNTNAGTPRSTAYTSAISGEGMTSPSREQARHPPLVLRLAPAVDARLAEGVLGRGRVFFVRASAALPYVVAL